MLAPMHAAEGPGHLQRPAKNRCPGFTLIEAALSGALLSIAAVGAMELIAATNMAGRDTSKRAAATALARQTADELAGVAGVAGNETECLFALNNAPGICTANGYTGANSPAACSTTVSDNGSFTRTVAYSPYVSGHIVPINIVISWSTAGRSSRVTTAAYAMCP